MTNRLWKTSPPHHKRLSSEGEGEDLPVPQVVQRIDHDIDEGNEFDVQFPHAFQALLVAMVAGAKLDVAEADSGGHEEGGRAQDVEETQDISAGRCGG